MAKLDSDFCTEKKQTFHLKLLTHTAAFQVVLNQSGQVAFWVFKSQKLCWTKVAKSLFAWVFRQSKNDLATLVQHRLLTVKNPKSELATLVKHKDLAF